MVGDGVEGGMGQPQQNVGGNVGNQGQYQNSNQNINVGTSVDNQGQMNYGGSTDINNGGVGADQNQQYGNNPYDNQNYQGSTLSPSGAEVGYQPFVPSGNTNYNNNNGNNGLGNQQSIFSICGTVSEGFLFQCITSRPISKTQTIRMLSIHQEEWLLVVQLLEVHHLTTHLTRVM